MTMGAYWNCLDKFTFRLGVEGEGGDFNVQPKLRSTELEAGGGVGMIGFTERGLVDDSCTLLLASSCRKIALTILYLYSEVFVLGDLADSVARACDS